jgi:hypothetical protein
MRAALMGFWPGKPTPVCIEHAATMENIANAMGISVPFVPLNDPDKECENCKNTVAETVDISLDT